MGQGPHHTLLFPFLPSCIPYKEFFLHIEKRSWVRQVVFNLRPNARRAVIPVFLVPRILCNSAHLYSFFSNRALALLLISRKLR